MGRGEKAKTAEGGWQQLADKTNDLTPKIG